MKWNLTFSRETVCGAIQVVIAETIALSLINKFPSNGNSCR